MRAIVELSPTPRDRCDYCGSTKSRGVIERATFDVRQAGLPEHVWTVHNDCIGNTVHIWTVSSDPHGSAEFGRMTDYCHDHGKHNDACVA